MMRIHSMQFHARVWLALILVFFVFFSAIAAPRTASAATTAEYYVPGSSDQLFQVLQDIDNDPDLGNAFGGGVCSVPPCNRLHNVITVIVDQNNGQVYYDHWENGYLSGAAGDEIYTVNLGDVLTFESSNIPVPRVANGTCTSTVKVNVSVTSTTTCYDGRDRIYVVGGVSVVEAFWPERTGTVFANAWDIYPIIALQGSYTIPVGENLAAAPTTYLDFDQVFVLVQAIQDGTSVQINDPAVAGIEVIATLNRGDVTQLPHINAGTTVTASSPVQVQFIVGQIDPGLSSESRSYTAVPSTLWESSYYSPVPGFGGGFDTNVFVHNPTNADLTINYQDQIGTGSFIVPANSTRSYQSLTGRFVPTNSALYLEAADHITKFWAIGSVDSENAAYNYGFTLIPPAQLTNDYYLGWAPGTTNLSANGSPVFVTPTADNTTIYVDYSPSDGMVDATYTLNRIQMAKIFDPDRDNTGMHIWATGSIALVWGEDPNTAAVGNPYIDAGYTILPTQLFLFVTPTPVPSNTPANPGGCTGNNCPTPVTGSGPALLLPVTGYQPNVVTDLSNVPFERYTKGDVTLEIPSLGVNISVVGVPRRSGTWNVAWLGNQAGWLEGSAFPSWKGNSVLTGHVYLASGRPGPFINLGKLKFGDKIVVYAYGQKNTFEVRTNVIVNPKDRSVMKHEELPWLTLLTCKDYDEKTRTYLYRIAVRAVLVDVQAIK